MTTIAIHFHGGTIGYAGATDGEPVRLGAEALLAGVPGLDHRLDLTLDGSDLVGLPRSGQVPGPARHRAGRHTDRAWLTETFAQVG